MAEYLDVIDKNGNLTGEVVDRKVAHHEGIRHRAAHLWLVRNKDGKIQVLLQKRSINKEAFPNCYDISSAGHVPAGEDFETSAIRELNEELGIHANKKDLMFCGDRNVVWDGEFNGKPFKDRQHSKVFLMWLDLDENECGFPRRCTRWRTAGHPDKSPHRSRHSVRKGTWHCPAYPF